jgi:hypothetical protein
MFSFGLMLTSAKEMNINEGEDFAPCSIRYEVFVNGVFSGYETHYNYSLSCSGQGTGIKVVTITPILA